MIEILRGILRNVLAALACEELLHLLGQLLKLCDRLVVLLLFHRAEYLAEGKADHIKHGKLRGVGLGRRNGDLGAGPGIEHIVRLARDRRANHVDDGEDIGAALFRLAQRGHGIERLARLGDDNDERLIVHDGVAVAEFGREHDLDIAAQQMLEIVLADHADMIRRAAGHNENAGKFAHFLDRELEIVEDNPAVLDARGDRAAQRLGLLHDLLEHKVLIAALFRGGNLPVDGKVLLFDLLLECVVDLDALARQHGDLAVLHVGDVARVLDDSRHVGGEEIAALAVAEQQRRVLARGDDAVGAVGAEHAERVSALDAAQHAAHGLQKVVALVVVEFKQLRHDLGIGLGLEGDALPDQEFLDLNIVFDDAVVNDGELSVLAHVGVGVGDIRRAVCRPAGVTKADAAFDVGAAVDLITEHLQPADSLSHLQFLL